MGFINSLVAASAALLIRPLNGAAAAPSRWSSSSVRRQRRPSVGGVGAARAGAAGEARPATEAEARAVGSDGRQGGAQQIPAGSRPSHAALGG